jgi:uncharacterized protein involved in exopolysaccharide biosynthesis
MSYVEYVNRPPGLVGTILNYSLFLPWTIKKLVDQSTSERKTIPKKRDTGESMVPTEEEQEAMKSIGGKISTSVEEETGLMNISVRASEAQLASSITERFLDHLTSRVREIRTQKVGERLEFVEERFQETEQELQRAEEQLAQFLERNQNPTTATLQFRQDRLQRQVSFKEQLYSELQSQLTQTNLELQKRKPVVTVLERPVPPEEPSSPNRILVVLISIVSGVVIGVTMIFVKEKIDLINEQKKSTNRI